MRQALAVFKEDLKDSIKHWKVLYVIAISAFIIAAFYASGFLQVLSILFLNPLKIIPWPISITYYLLFICMPLFALVLGYDAISSEHERSTIRGVISKISRESFIIGKFMSVFTIISALAFLLLTSSALFTYKLTSQLDIFHPLVFFLYLLLYIAALLSVSLFFSSLTHKSSASLLTTLFFYSFLLSLKTRLPLLSVFSYMQNIVTMQNITPAIIIFISYIFIFITATMLIFKVRDI